MCLLCCAVCCRDDWKHYNIQIIILWTTARRMHVHYSILCVSKYVPTCPKLSPPIHIRTLCVAREIDRHGSANPRMSFVRTRELGTIERVRNNTSSNTDNKKLKVFIVVEFFAYARRIQRIDCACFVVVRYRGRVNCKFMILRWRTHTLCERVYMLTIKHCTKYKHVESIHRRSINSMIFWNIFGIFSMIFLD